MLASVNVQGMHPLALSQDYVMLTKWLPDTPSTLPPNASHQVGVGAFVLNEQREVREQGARCGAAGGGG